MQEKENSLCFSAHINEKLPQSEEQLGKLKTMIWREVDQAIEDGITTFYYGGCYGFELLAADIIVKHQKVISMVNPKAIRLIAVLPYEEQANDWNEDDRELYFNLLAKCNNVITLNTRFKMGCYCESSHYMVDHSSKLICYCSDIENKTQSTKDYAEKNNLKIINLYDEMDH